MSHVPWSRICHAAEAIETAGTPPDLFEKTLQQLELLIPSDHAVAVPNMNIHEVSQRVGRPNDKMIIHNAPSRFWPSYVEYYEALDPTQNTASYQALPTVSMVDLSRVSGSEFGRDFLQKYGVGFRLCLSNLTLTDGSGFLIVLHRGVRTPFTEREIASASAFFPHINNLSILLAHPDGERATRARETAAAAGLSKREQEVAILLSERMSILEIAERLFISRHTVEKHMQHIYWKLKAPGKDAVRRMLLGE